MRYRKRRKKAKQTLAMTILIVGALATLLVLMVSRVFVVRDIMVVGNRNLLREEVATQSGVQIGDNVLSITASGLRRELEKNRYIRYVGHEFDYRGTLTLRIEERLGMAVVHDLGYCYVLGETGVVLENAGESYPTDVAGPVIQGLNLGVNSRVIVGEVIPVQDQEQLNAMKSVLAALDDTNMLARASVLSLESLDNINVMTPEGAMIVLGDSGDLMTKLLIAREVLAIREDMDDKLMGARIDVSSGKDAHYIPSVLPTVTPVPTATPTIAPPVTPKP